MAINPTVGTRTALTVTGFSTLGSGTYCVSNAYNCNTNKPVDVIVEVNVATTNAVAGNKQCKVFIKASLDGTNFQSGPESGTTTTDEPDLTPLGVVPMNTSTTTHTGFFSVGQALGYVPYAFKIIPYDDCGVALTSASIYTSEISIP